DHARTRRRPRRGEHGGAVRGHGPAADGLEGRMSDVPALRTEGLGKRYGSNWALRDCTLQVPSGSVTALVGPNGAGKTTLLQLAVGLIAPSAGSIDVLDRSPQDDAGDLLPRIGFVAQEHPLCRGFTVAEMLTL